MGHGLSRGLKLTCCVVSGQLQSLSFASSDYALAPETTVVQPWGDFITVVSDSSQGFLGEFPLSTPAVTGGLHRCRGSRGHSLRGGSSTALRDGHAL